MDWGAYQRIIRGEGILGSDLANITAEDQAQRSGLRSHLGSLFGDYGAVPEGYADKLGVLTPEVRDLAGRNQFSTLKQLDRTRKTARGGLRARLAARGAMVSGENALGEGEIGYQHGLANYGALRDLMGQVGSAESGYADDVRKRFGDQTAAYTDAQGRLLESGFSPPAAAGAAPGSPGAGPLPAPGRPLPGAPGTPRATDANGNFAGLGYGQAQIDAELKRNQGAANSWWKNRKPAVGKDAQFIRNQQKKLRASGDPRWWVP